MDTLDLGGRCFNKNEMLQEADESQLWLEMLREACGINGPELKHLLAETEEIISIFTTMVSRSRKNGS